MLQHEVSSQQFFASAWAVAIKANVNTRPVKAELILFISKSPFFTIAAGYGCLSAMNRALEVQP